jgi:hypothetical protein
LLYRKGNDKDLESLLPTKRYALIFLKRTTYKDYFISIVGEESVLREGAELILQ